MSTEGPHLQLGHSMESCSPMGDTLRLGSPFWRSDGMSQSIRGLAGEWGRKTQSIPGFV